MNKFMNQIRPKEINDIVGQEHIKPLLKKMVEMNEKTSLILYGKPGIGKTSIAYALANEWNLTYMYFNASTDNKKTLENCIEISDLIIIDEIHRLNKDKQDILLPALERKNIKIIATTTENPFFTIVPALRSRTHILQLNALSTKDILKGLRNIIKKYNIDININDMTLKMVATASNGDFRYALNSIHLISKLYIGQKITEKIIKIVLPSSHFYSDKNGDGHYNLLSSFHKSLRGSDIDASLYYLYLLLKSGDLLGLERRMIMVAYEDIGLANPNLTIRVTKALENAKKVGWPENKIILSYAVIELCKSPKSNSAYIAISNIEKHIEEFGIHPIPKHLKDAHYKSSSKLGNGVGYKYPHDYGGFVEQQYLPDDIVDAKFFKKNKNDKI